MEDEEDERFEHTMTPELVSAVFDDMKEMIKTTKDPVEINDYLRSLVKELIIITHPMYPMDRIFSLISDEIHRIFRESQEEFLSNKYTNPLNCLNLLIQWTTQWTTPLYYLMMASYIRRETLDLNGNIIAWSEEELCDSVTRIIDSGYCHINDGVTVIQMERWVSWNNQYKVDDDQQGFCLNRVILEEHEDRYVEKYPVWDDYVALDEKGMEHDELYYERMQDIEERMDDEMARHKIIEMKANTIWKRDLWKNELHTQPFKSIHLEILYSPDLPAWYMNKCREAKEHFESLI